MKICVPPWAIAVLMFVSFAGCSSLDTAGLRSPFDPVASKSAQPSTGESTTPSPGVATCSVEFWSDSERLKQVSIPIREGMCVKDLIAASRATKQFNRIRVELARQLPDGSWHKMNVVVENGGSRVDPGYDYAIRPGDRLLVSEDPTTAIERMVQSMMKV